MANLDPDQLTLLTRLEKVFAGIVLTNIKIQELEKVSLDVLPLLDRVGLTDRERQLIAMNSRFCLKELRKLNDGLCEDVLPLLLILKDLFPTHYADARGVLCAPDGREIRPGAD